MAILKAETPGITPPTGGRNNPLPGPRRARPPRGGATEDIHRYARVLERNLALLGKEPAITEENRRAIRDYTESRMGSPNLAVSSVARDVSSLLAVARVCPKDFVECDRKDVEGVVRRLRERGKAEPTLHGWMVSIKTLFKWLRETEGYPPEVAWISTSTPRRLERLPETVIEEPEVLGLLQAAENLRDKALISLLFDAGPRVGEILPMRIRDVVFNGNGGLDYVLLQKSKTQPRRVPIIPAAPHLARWLEVHPARGNPAGPLWVGLGTRGHGEPLRYHALREMLQRVADKAGVKKEIHPHNFRHSAATRDARFMTEAQLKLKYGWAPRSTEAATYVHLSGRDLDPTTAKHYGRAIPEDRPAESLLRPRPCPRCALEAVAPEVRYCPRCAAPMDVKAALEREEGLGRERNDIAAFLRTLAEESERAPKEVRGWLETVARRARA